MVMMLEKLNMLSVLAIFQLLIKVCFPTTDLCTYLVFINMLNIITFLSRSHDLKAHLNTTKHKSRIASSAVLSSIILDNFVINKITPEILKVSVVEGTLVFRTVVHHHSYLDLWIIIL
jgi:hypothetical protein